jgi:hypothetical protein
MPRKNWDKIAAKEFENMDPDEQASFIDLYDRVR